MKKFTLTFALIFSILGSSIAQNSNNPSEVSATVRLETIAQAREIANALQLNEADYQKVKEIIRIKVLETEQAKIAFKENAEGLTLTIQNLQKQAHNNILQVLNADQQKAYISFTKLQVTSTFLSQK